MRKDNPRIPQKHSFMGGKAEWGTRSRDLRKRALVGVRMAFVALQSQGKPWPAFKLSQSQR